MTFETEKEAALSKADLSKKGSVDESVLPLCDFVNGLDDYYTTSSCSGRIAVLAMSSSGRKNESSWLYVSHDLADADEVLSALIDLSADQVWLRFDPMILHIACRDIVSAGRMIELMKEAGFKRTGIVSVDRSVIEMIGVDRLEVPVARDGVLLVDEKYVRTLVAVANEKMERNKRRIKRLHDALLKLKSG